MTRPTFHPLRRWRARNFKSIADADVELAPLTVLVGANSSGKSSLLQSMLLAAQQAAVPSHGAAVALNGPLVQLGELGDVRRAGARRGEAVAIGAAVAPGGRHRAVAADLEWDIELVAAPRRHGGGMARLRRVRLSGPTDAGGRVELVADRRVTRPLQPTSGADLASPTPMAPLAGTIGWTGGGSEDGVARTVGLALRGGLPETVFVRSDRTEVAVDGWLRRIRQAFDDRRRPPAAGVEPAAAGAGEPDELAEAAVGRLVPLVASAIRVAETDDGRSGAEIARVFVMFDELRRDAVARGYWRSLAARAAPGRLAAELTAAVGPRGSVARPAVEDPRSADAAAHLEGASAALIRLLSARLLHLGPLRQDPQVLHRSEPTGRPGAVGSKGEYAVSVLHGQADREVVCPVADGSVRELPLREAVGHWLAALGVATAVRTSDRAQLGIEVAIEVPDGPGGLSLTSVGVGVSQVLPVLVMALASDPGSVLLIEQPELHLHPAVQQRLGDFLLACAASGRQVIVETHSDHLVTRLRRRIAEDPEDGLLELVSLILTERVDGSTRFRPLATNRFGGLDDWPDGFFDEAAADSRELLRAGLRKRGGDS